MNALESSETSDSGPTVGEKSEGEPKLGPTKKGSKVVSLADGPATGEDGEAYPPRRRSKQGTRDTQRSENPSLARRVTELFVAEHPVKHEPTFRASAIAIVKASWLNVLLVFIPVSLPIPAGPSLKLSLDFVFSVYRSAGLATLRTSTIPSSSYSSESLSERILDGTEY